MGTVASCCTERDDSMVPHTTKRAAGSEQRASRTGQQHTNWRPGTWFKQPSGIHHASARHAPSIRLAHKPVATGRSALGIDAVAARREHKETSRSPDCSPAKSATEPNFRRANGTMPEATYPTLMTAGNIAFKKVNSAASKAFLAESEIWSASKSYDEPLLERELSESDPAESQLSIEEVKSRALALFSQGSYRQHATWCSKCISLAESASFADVPARARSIMYADRALSYMMLKKYRIAEADCISALNLDGTNVKARFRLARLAFKLGDHEKAFLDIEHILRKYSSHRYSRKALKLRKVIMATIGKLRWKALRKPLFPKVRQINKQQPINKCR